MLILASVHKKNTSKFASTRSLCSCNMILLNLGKNTSKFAY